MRVLRLASIVLVLSAFPARAASMSERPDAVSIVIYPNGNMMSTDAMVHPEPDETWEAFAGLAYITETRTVDLEAGDSEIRFRNVASSMIPQTADIQGLPEGTLERNFDYDLLSPGSLLARSIGQSVHLVRTDPKTGRQTEQSAIVRSTEAGGVLEVDGKFEALHCSGLPERLEFDTVPEGLTSTPTLAVKTHASAPGRHTVRLSYLATGLSWSADYVARVHPEGDALDLSGFVTLGNFDDTSFRNVPVQFVGGQLHTFAGEEPKPTEPLEIATRCWPSSVSSLYSTSPVTAVGQQEMKFEGTVETVVVTGSRMPDPRALGDYKLYSLPEPTDILASEVKQIGFLDQRSVAFQKIYSYKVDSDLSDASPPGAEPADILYRLRNEAGAGLGKPLPSGLVSVMDSTSAGNPVLVGQASIGNIPVGLPLDLDTGRALDVNVERHVVAVEKIENRNGKLRRESLKIAIENAKPVPIRFELEQTYYDEARSRIVSEDKPHSAIPNGVRWTFDLKAGETILFNYTLEQPG